MKIQTRSLIAVNVVLAAVIALMGCDKEQKVTPVQTATPAAATPATETPAAQAPAMPAMPSTPVLTPGMGMPGINTPAAPGVATPADKLELGDISWTLPAGWATKPASGMRLATLVSPEGPEVSVTRLTGDGGGMLMNINRWRGQLMLPPVEEGKLTETSKVIEANGVSVTLVDVESTQGRIVGAIIPVGGSTYFLKAQGPDAAVVGKISEAVATIAASTRVK